MVFNSFEFLFLFLPLVVIGYYALISYSLARASIGLLLIGSLVYYGYWNPIYLLLIGASIIGNFSICKLISRSRCGMKKLMFCLGICLNVGLIGYFKYTDFFIQIANESLGTGIPLQHIALPLAISFFTFQQVAFVVDTYKGTIEKYSFLDYALFISFFPQLVAGPIVYHAEMMPQFSSKTARVVNWENIYKGIVLLTVGLGKKVLLADGLSPFVQVIFDRVVNPTWDEALCGTWAYALQLYFDFSGYTDMALGAALMFNIFLPQNFNSPYRSTSIQDFWRRWHMTLSRWLKDYIYIPLGGSRKGRSRTLVNVMLTFLLGGLWHGAGWGFVIWGALHGTALALQRVWSWTGIRIHCFFGWLTTTLFVFLAWIPFRALTLDKAKGIYLGLVGYNGFKFSQYFNHTIDSMGFSQARMFNLLAVATVLAIATPNSMWLIRKIRVHWAVTLYSMALAIGSIVAMFNKNYVSEFIYFQF
ncbi:MBOAT family protein [Pseudodesulfovibrio sp.]|nr:MBOAT family protein [Pseudodesulfovibrio sp.]